MKTWCKQITRSVFVFSTLILFALNTFSQLTVENVDAGPYTPGSNIAAQFKIGSAACIAITNTFELYLSDANGSFVSEQRIGTYVGFYSTYVNGIIPITTPDGTGYRIRIKSTAPASVSDESIPFEVKAGVPVRAEINSRSLTSRANQEAFGLCITQANVDFALSNNSTTAAIVDANIKNELSNGTTVLNLNLPKVFTAEFSHYTIFVKATMPDGSVGTKAYLIVNNQATTAFATVNSNAVCLPLASYQFNVDLSASGILNNFPGDRYVINWGDGTSTTYTFCDISNAGGKVGHDYTASSCGRISNSATGPIYNAFDVTIRVANDFCGNLGTPISSYAKVVIKPVNSFTFASPACTNAPVTFTNTSLLGENPDTATPGCIPNDVTYNWFVDDVLIEANKPRSYDFVYPFPSHGIHRVRLTSVSYGACNANDVEQEICIQDPPKPIFSLRSVSVCAPDRLAPVNVSEFDNVCNSVPAYLWTVTPAVTFVGGTSATSKDPIFNFEAAGTYSITLSVSNGVCGTVVSAPQIVTVLGANAGPDQIICDVSTTTVNANNDLTGFWAQVAGPPVNIDVPSQHNTGITGILPGNTYTFRWTITGGTCPNSYDDVNIVYAAPIVNTIANGTITVCSGQTVTILGDTPSGGNGNYTYKWQSSADNGNWIDLTGANLKDLGLSVTALTYFRRIVSSNSCSSISNSVQVDVLPAINNNSISINQTICLGGPITPLTGSLPTGANGTFIYQWQTSTNGTTWINVAGATDKDYTPIQPTVTTSYRRLVSSGACAGGLPTPSDIVVITVNQPAKAEILYTNDIGCAPFLITAINVKAGIYPQNATYTWFANDVPIPNGNQATFPGYTIIGSNTSVTIKLVVTANSGCLTAQETHVFATREDVTVAFAQDKTNGCGPFDVSFTNNSSTLTDVSFLWDFGNGTTSNLASPPNVTYLPDPAGEDIAYVVILKATTPCGIVTRTSTVLVKAAPISIFSPNKTIGCSPFTASFSNTSPGNYTSFTFDFGDGSPTLTTTDKSNISHTYITNQVTDYIVKMTARNDCSASESQYSIRVSPNNITAELVVNSTESKGCAPLEVNFYNNTKGASSFYYDFGDGSSAITTSAPEMIAHTFSKPGIYIVKLYATNDCSSNSTTETIEVLEQPTVAFTADRTVSCSGTEIKFRNNSTNAIAYLWDFGDGTTSNQFEPEHTYTGNGTSYSVSLTATNIQGCKNTIILPNYIQLVTPPQSNFTVLPGNDLTIPNYTFTFRDASLNAGGSWEWNFGDETVSTIQNPTHTYANVGDYTVTLKVSNKEGCSATSSQLVRIIGVPGFLYLPNSFMPGSAKNELQTFKAKGRGIDNWTMTIFNKWGQVLWETTKLDDGAPLESWDGTYQGQPQPQGVYFWKIEVKFINGSEWKGMTYDSSPPKKTGNIYLIR